MDGSRDHVHQSSKGPAVFSDVVYEILLMLHVKTLIRLRCVCKSWNSLISQPDFQREHYRHRLPQNPLVLVAKHEFDSHLFITRLHFSTYTDQGATHTVFSKSVPKSRSAYMQKQSCLGIVCIASEDAILLCNPSTEELNVLPPPPTQGFNQRVGFGYTGTSEEFKVVRFFKLKINEEPILDYQSYCEVFTLGSCHRWREARSPPFHPRLDSPFLHGALHLLPEYYQEQDSHYIAAFNLDTQEYKVIMLPEIYFCEGRNVFASISEVSGSLCLIFDFFRIKRSTEVCLIFDFFRRGRTMASSEKIPLLFCLLLLPAISATWVSHDGRAISINGQRRVLFSGSIHYPRSTPQMWPDLIRKAKEGGLDAIETYVFWNAHEPRRREYNFQGNADLVRFIREIQNAGLYAVLRIGPYVCAEWNYGGIPAWLRQIPDMQFRTDNQPFKDEMQNFTTLIVNMLKNEKLLADQGGPIIITQIENEYGNVQWTYGDAGKSYMKWAANLAESFNLRIPWIMCQQGDAPQPMINTCNGFYCDTFYPNNQNSPKMFTENWSGWFKAWDKPDYHRLVEDLAFSVARFLQYKGTFMNYYMYHGGTNFGRTTGGPYITTSYDYDAPLDEYGNLRQPKWGHLKDLHAAAKMMENALVHGDFSDTGMGNGISVTKYTINGTSSCFISNANQSADATVNYQGNNYFLPAWSVSFLPDCKNEVYNTAKVNAQTSIMVKKSNQEEDEPAVLKWSWRPEPLKHYLSGKGGSFSANKLLEQITTAADGSDYLWYITSVDVAHAELMTLHVSTTGHVLHAFVNGLLVGSQYAPNGGFKFVFERAVQMKAGTNYISLLSVTVGLKNYGGQYELEPAGIVGGPVLLIGGNITYDLSNSLWSYKVGLWGMDKKFYRSSPKQDSKWHSDKLPTNKTFTWYKTTFKAPQGANPVVVDLLGMGKGEAWVNGQSIGRFWPNYITSPNGCSPCDYRGAFKQDSCRTGCGGPAQRWYHVPRSFLTEDGPNTLTLFEEAGGNPSQVNFQIVTTGTICANALEGSKVTLSCQGGQTISDIVFASFGNPQGGCQSFKKGSCETNDALSVVKKACIGQVSCSINVNEATLGAAPTCKGITKRLAVQAVC